MFSKKPATPKAPWAIRVLTPDFLIDGYYDAEAHAGAWPFFGPQTGALSAEMLWLDSPRFTPVTDVSGPAPTMTNWLMPYGGNLVALMPFDDTSLAAMQKNLSHDNYPLPAALYVGPYLFRGQLLSRYSKPNELYLMALFHSLAVLNVEIECHLPGAQFTVLKSPLAIVRTHLMHGFGLIG